MKKSKGDLKNEQNFSIIFKKLKKNMYKTLDITQKDESQNSGYKQASKPNFPKNDYCVPCRHISSGNKMLFFWKIWLCLVTTFFSFTVWLITDKLGSLLGENITQIRYKWSEAIKTLEKGMFRTIYEITDKIFLKKRQIV